MIVLVLAQALVYTVIAPETDITQTGHVTYIPMNESSGTNAYDYKSLGGRNNLTLGGSDDTIFTTIGDNQKALFFAVPDCCSENTLKNSDAMNFTVGQDASFCFELEQYSLEQDAYVWKIGCGAASFIYMKTDGDLTGQILGGAISGTHPKLYVNNVYHICGSFDNSEDTLTWYINGTINETETANQNFDCHATVKIGHEDWNTKRINGTLRGFRWWNGYAITADDVRTVFNQDIQKNTSPPTPGIPTNQSILLENVTNISITSSSAIVIGQSDVSGNYTLCLNGVCYYNSTITKDGRVSATGLSSSTAHTGNLTVSAGDNQSTFANVSVSFTTSTIPLVNGGIVINLTFDNYSTPWYDYSGLHHEFNVIGSVTNTNNSICKWYGCVNFSSDGIDYLNSTSKFSLDDGMAMSFWVYHNVAPSGASPMMVYVFGEGENTKYTQQGGYYYSTSWAAENATISQSLEASIPVTTWQHVFVQYSPTSENLTLWVNGEIKRNTNHAGAGDLNYTVGEVLKVGLGLYNIDLLGYMDEFLVWNRSNFTTSDVYNIWDDKRLGTPPLLDVYTGELSYDLPYNYSHHRNALITGGSMKFSINITNAGSTSAGAFNVSINISDSILCSRRITVSTLNFTPISCNWTTSYGFHKGWVIIDTEGELTEDGTDSSTNNLQHIYIPFLDRPWFGFNYTEWTDEIFPYTSNSSNTIAYDSYGMKGFDSEDWNAGWTAADVDPRGKKGRENAVACFLNNWTEPDSGSGKTQCSDAIEFLYGWGYLDGWDSASVQAIHELAHVMVNYDLMQPNLTQEQDKNISRQFASICNDITTHLDTQPYSDTEGGINGGNGWGFGSGMGSFCYGMLGASEGNPTLMTDIGDEYWHYNSPDEWMDREEAYMYSFKNDSWAHYQEGWNYKFYSQYHMVENALFFRRYDLGEFDNFNNAYCSMANEMITDLLDFNYNGLALRNDEDRYTRGIQRGDSNSYEDPGSDTTLKAGILTYYGILCDDQDTKNSILFLRNLSYGFNGDDALQESYAFQQLERDSNFTSPEGVMPRTIFDNSNDIFTIRMNYTYINDTVIQIDGGEERGGGHSQAQGYYLYALGEPFLDYEQVPYEDDVRAETWKNGISLQNDIQTSEGQSGFYSQTCGNAPLNQYYGMIDCSNLTYPTNYPNARDFPLQYGGDLENYVGTEDGKFAGVRVWRPYEDASNVEEDFIVYDGLLVRRARVSNVSEGAGIFDNKVNLNSEFNETITGTVITYNRNNTNKFLTSTLVYTSDADVSIDNNPKNITACKSKTSCIDHYRFNTTYQRITRWADNTSWDFIEVNDWYYAGNQETITAIDSTDKGISFDGKTVLFDMDNSNTINYSNWNIEGWGAVIDNNTEEIGAFNTTSISEGSINLLSSNLTLSAHLKRTSNKITLTANTMFRDQYIDFPRNVEVIIDAQELTNSSNFTVLKNGVGSDIKTLETGTTVTFTVNTEQNSDYYEITGATAGATIPTNQSILLENVTNVSVTQTSATVLSDTNITAKATVRINGLEFTNNTYTKHQRVPLTGLSTYTSYSGNITVYAQDNNSIYSNVSISFTTSNSLSLSETSLLALNGTYNSLGAFNTSTSDSVEYMRINFSIITNTGIDDWYFNFTADGKSGCSLGNLQSTVCYNYDNDTYKWIQFKNNSVTSTYNGGSDGSNQGDFIKPTLVGGNLSLLIDEHYNPNVFKWYNASYNFSDVKWQSETTKRITKDNYVRVNLKGLIPLDADLYKLDFRVNCSTNQPTQPLQAYGCNSTYTIGDPETSNYCNLIASKSCDELIDDGTKFKGSFTKNFIDSTGDGKYLVLKTDEINPTRNYFLKTYKVTAANYTSQLEYSNDYGDTWNRNNDGYETEVNINWFNDGVDPTMFRYALWVNTTDGIESSIEGNMTWNINATNNYEPLISLSNPKDGENVTANVTYEVNFTSFDTNKDNLNITTYLFNSTGLYNTIITNLNTSNSSFLWSVPNVEGYYNMTLQACELSTTELYCDNTTHNINIIKSSTNQKIGLYYLDAINIDTNSFVIMGNTNITVNASALVNGVEYTNPTITQNVSISVVGLGSNTLYKWNVTLYSSVNQSITLFNGTFNVNTLAAAGGGGGGYVAPTTTIINDTNTSIILDDLDESIISKIIDFFTDNDTNKSIVLDDPSITIENDEEELRVIILIFGGVLLILFGVVVLTFIFKKK